MIKDSFNPTIYLVQDGAKRSIPSAQVYTSQGFVWGASKRTVSGDGSMSFGTAVGFREGTLLKGSAPTIYVVDDVSGALQKRAIPSATVYFGLGYKSGESLLVADSALPAASGSDLTLTAHPDGSFVKAANLPTVYLLETGTKRAIPSGNIFVSQGFAWSKIRIATASDLALPNGADVAFREGTLIKGSAPTVYIVDIVSGTAQKRAFQTGSGFLYLGYTFTQVMKVGDSELPATNGTPIP